MLNVKPQHFTLKWLSKNMTLMTAITVSILHYLQLDKTYFLCHFLDAPSILFSQIKSLTLAQQTIVVSEQRKRKKAVKQHETRQLFDDLDCKINKKIYIFLGSSSIDLGKHAKFETFSKCVPLHSKHFMIFHHEIFC
jgi:hypothetical protein